MREKLERQLNNVNEIPKHVQTGLQLFESLPWRRRVGVRSNYSQTRIHTQRIVQKTKPCGATNGVIWIRLERSESDVAPVARRPP